MSVLHMSTEDVLGAAQDLDFAVNELYLKPTKLRGMANSIANSWDSPKAQYYAGELRRLASLLHTEIINLQRLAKDARVEAAEWEAADQSWTTSTLNITAYTTSLGIILESNPEQEWNVSSIPSKNWQEFDWWKAGAGGLRVTNDGLKVIKYVGNLGNNAIPWVSGLATVGLFAGVATDLGSGDGWGRAIGSELLEFGAKKLIYAVPIIGVPYLIYDIALGVGQLTAGGLEIAGMHDQAIYLQNTVGQLDVVDNLADSVYDFGMNYIKNASDTPELLNITVSITISNCGLQSV